MSAPVKNRLNTITPAPWYTQVEPVPKPAPAPTITYTFTWVGLGVFLLLLYIWSKSNIGHQVLWYGAVLILLLLVVLNYKQILADMFIKS